MNNERRIIYRICKLAEKEFDAICYAYKDKRFWSVCIDDYSKYLSKEYKDFISSCKQKTRAMGLKVVFFYSQPNEKMLYELAKEDNLILVI